MRLFGSRSGAKKKPSSGLSPEVARIFEKINRVMTDENLQNSMYPAILRDKIAAAPAVDEIPNAAGEFGRSAENPIPANGPIGELVYLSQLQIEGTDQRLLYHRLGSVRAIDIYETVSIDGRTWDILFLSLYHPRKSRKAPRSYVIADPRSQPLLYGTNRRVEHFPYGLQKAIGETNKEFFGIALPPPQVRIAEESTKFSGLVRMKCVSVL